MGIVTANLARSHYKRKPPLRRGFSAFCYAMHGLGRGSVARPSRGYRQFQELRKDHLARDQPAPCRLRLEIRAFPLVGP